MIFRNKRLFSLKTCFVFLLCWSLASKVKPYNIELSSMFKIKDFEIYKGIFMYIQMDLIIQCVHYFNITLGPHFYFQ